MTRRQLLNLAFPGAAVTLKGEAATPVTAATLASIANQLDLVVIPLLWTNGLVPEAVSVSGRYVGKLVLPDSPWAVSVSPDCGWISWYPRRSLPPPFGVGDGRIYFTDAQSSTGAVRLSERYPGLLALSSGAVHLALTTVAGIPPDPRLCVLNPRTGELEQDLTGLVTRFQIADIERLCVSATGQRLAAGTRELFIVVDVPSRKVLLESKGRFPCLSPNGDSIAFVSNDELISISLRTRAATKVVKGWDAVLGLGSWSPEGRFLLAGIRSFLSFSVKLVAIDCTTGEFTDIFSPLQEDSLGEQSVWMKRRLLNVPSDAAR
jgi:hypothetical protein